MALKRTQVPFYGKRETRLVAAGAAAMRAGDKEAAAGFHARAARSIRNRWEAHMHNGRRKACRTGGAQRRGY